MSRAIQKLNARHAAFVVEFVACLNATQAAIRAGYAAKSASVTGSQLLRNPKITEAIEKERSKAMIRTELSQTMVLDEAKLLAFSDVTDYQMDDAGNLKPADGKPASVMRAVSSIKRTVRVDKDGTVERTVEFRLWDKPGTLKLVGRHVGLFPSKDQAAIEAAAAAEVDKRIEARRRELEQQRALAENRDAERERAGVVDVVAVEAAKPEETNQGGS